MSLPSIKAQTEYIESSCGRVERRKTGTFDVYYKIGSGIIQRWGTVAVGLTTAEFRSLTLDDMQARKRRAAAQ
jgi:hypothetical protein